MKRTIALSLVLLALSCFRLRLSAAEPDAHDMLVLHTRSRERISPDRFQWQLVYRTARWDTEKTAIVICDMWDRHWCESATARVAEMAPRMNDLIARARKRGVLIIHCPSGTMEFYRDTPQRKLAQQAPKVEPKVPLRGWCPLDPDREYYRLPIDDSDGGCDTPGCKPEKTWSRQIDTIEMAPGDAVTDSVEAYYLMRQRGIENVIVMGVHTNMCVLGRPFGIRQLVYQGMRVVLCRDLTDSMYNPQREPHVSHFRGTEMVVEHIEKYWCPTITSSDLLGGAEFTFRDDRRPHVVFLVNEDEYGARATLPAFAQLLRDCFHYRCTSVLGQGGHDLPGIEALRTADVAVLFVRRRALPSRQMEVLRTYLDSGRPLVALRTASHAFSVRGRPPAGCEQWPTFDRDVLGCHYHGHGPNQLGANVTVDPAATDHPILANVVPRRWHSRGSIYVVTPIDRQAEVLLVGSVLDTTQPVAWTRKNNGARVFYTSLGHRDDFQQPQFQMLLVGAIHWAMDRPVPELNLEQRPDFASRWVSMSVPGTWESRSGGHLLGYDGFAWYRCLVNVPLAWRGNDLKLFVPEVDNAHQAFFNGKKVGGAGSLPPHYVNGLGTEKPCTLSAANVRFGRPNLLAVRVYDSGGRGGFKGRAPSIRLDDEVIRLEGEWQFCTGDDLRWAEPGAPADARPPAFP